MSDTMTQGQEAMSESEYYYTPDDIAKKLNVSSMTVYRIIQKGDMDAIRVGSSYRIPAEEFAAYLEKKRVSRERE